MLEENLSLIDNGRDHRGGIFGLGLIVVDDRSGQAAEHAAEAHLLAGHVFVGGVRIEQGVFDEARLELWGHLARQLDDRISVDHGPLAVADEIQVDRSVRGKRSGGIEDHPREPRRLFDRLTGSAALLHPVVCNDRIEALMPHHVGGFDLPGRAVGPARVLNSAMGHDPDCVHAK